MTKSTGRKDASRRSQKTGIKGNISAKGDRALISLLRVSLGIYRDGYRQVLEWWVAEVKYRVRLQDEIKKLKRAYSGKSKGISNKMHKRRLK